MSHPCPAPRCYTIVTDDLLTCREHWFKIPRALRMEVWRTYRARQLKASVERIEAHQQACDRALETLT